MSVVLNGSSQYLDASSTLLSNEPIGISAWFNPNNVTTNYVIAALGDNGTAGNYNISTPGGVAGDPVRAVKNNDAGTGAVIADTSTGFSASTWQHGAAVFRSDTSRDAYLNGGSKGSNATSRTDPTPNFITIGALHLSSGFIQPFGGSLAEVYFMDYAPTDAENALLGKGVHPFDAAIPLANVRAWYPIMGEYNNRMAGGYPNLTATGSPTLGSHPAQPIYPRIGALMCL